MKRWIVFGWCLGATWSLLAAGPAVAGMDLVLQAERRSYLLGEPVGVVVRATNNANEVVVTDALLNPELGFLQVYIAEEGGEFRQYLGPGWGTRDVFMRPAPVLRGATFEIKINLLWNNDIVSNRRALKRAFAFPEVRCYQIKAKAFLPGFDSESNTIEICTTPPTGRDLAIWRSFVEEPELARFVQRPEADVPPAIRVRAETVLRENASAPLARYLRDAIEERRAFDSRKVR